MTPREYFDSQPHGSIKKCAAKIGFHYVSLLYVVNSNRAASPFMAQCLVDYSVGKITMDKVFVGRDPSSSRKKSMNAEGVAA